MESGIIELMPVFKGSTATTAEEMKEYVQGVVTRFCAVTDLTVIKTDDHERGAAFILGEEGKDQGIVMIGNSSAANYFYNDILITRVGINNTPTSGVATASPSPKHGFQNLFNSYPVWMKYIKCDHGIIAGISASSDPSITYTPRLIIQKARNTLQEDRVFLLIYNSNIMASYRELLENDNKDTELFSFGDISYPIIPADKEAVSDIYLASGAELYGMKLYTNKKGTAAMNKVAVNGRQYVVAATGKAFSLIMEATESGVAQQ